MNNYHRDVDDVCALGRARAVLSGREQQVLGLLVDGFSNRQIAEELGLKFYTASTHVKNIYRKLGVRKRTDAVVAALAGWHLKTNQNLVPDDATHFRGKEPMVCCELI